MMPHYLLDTNSISEPLRPVPEPVVVGRIKAYADLLALPSVERFSGLTIENWFAYRRAELL